MPYSLYRGEGLEKIPAPAARLRASGGHVPLYNERHLRALRHSRNRQRDQIIRKRLGPVRHSPDPGSGARHDALHSDDRHRRGHLRPALDLALRPERAAAFVTHPLRRGERHGQQRLAPLLRHRHPAHRDRQAGLHNRPCKAARLPQGL